MNTEQSVTTPETSLNEKQTTLEKVSGYLPTSIKIILVVIVVYFLYKFITEFTNSSAFQFGKDLLNTTDKVFAFADDQLKSCTSSLANFFNPASGCFLGIGILVFGTLKIACYGLSKVSSKSQAMAKAEFLTGKNSAEISKELVENANKNKESMIDSLKESLGREPTKAEVNYMMRESLNKNLADISKNAIEKSSQSEANKKAQIEQVTQIEKSMSEINETEARENEVEDKSREEANKIIEDHPIEG